ncbi:MAG: preprotein translocase, SecE subunit [Phycisphaerales bacterium]|nr:preprotein translocase, SecE subunit [Phycisphaerales bacterium]
MASVTKTKDGNSAMADDELPDEAEGEKEGGKGGPSKSSKAPTIDYGRKGDRGTGFFTIYKKGQGYWTRMGTVIGLGLVCAFTAYNLYAYIPTFLPSPSGTSPAEVKASQVLHTQIALAVAGGFVLGFFLLCWKLMNKPTNVDFLIATDSEMKKVNWTSRKELIGSTKVVVIFMFLVALFLFGVDQIFGVLMWAAGVLKFSPWNF